jgi:hypothetical protein
MFEFTGNWKGSMVQDKLVSGQELLEEYKLPFPENKRIVRFQLNLSNKMVASKKEGRVQVSPGRSILCKIQGVHNGQTVLIRYFENKLVREGSTTPIYTPAKVQWRKKQMIVNLDKDFEIAVLLALRPECKTSPFRRANKGYIYQILDVEKQASEELNAAKTDIALQYKIMHELSDDFVVAFAKGYTTKNKWGLGLSSEASADEARAALVKQAKLDPHRMNAQLSSNSALLNGAVRDALDKGVIRNEDVGNNVFNWTWSDGTEIARVEKPGTDPLVEALILDGNDRAFFKRMNLHKTMEDYDKQEINTPSTVKSEKHPVDFAVAEGLITFDYKASKVVSLERIVNGVQICSEGKTVRANIPKDQNWIDFVKGDETAMKRISAIVDLLKNNQ